MHPFLRRWLALFCLLLIAPLHAQTAESPDAVAAPAPEIALITFGPGPIYWERFGHNAILVREPGSVRGRLYNYGMFDFAQENFFLNFARGRMLYRLAVQNFPGALGSYAEEQRWAYFQELDLPEAARRELAEFLAWNAAPENADYRYDYFRANCSTRVRDALDEASGGALKRISVGVETSRSFRFEATRLIGPDLALALLMDLGMGPSADEPIDLWQQSFVPMVLKDVVARAQLAGDDGSTRPLVKREGWLLQSEARPEPAEPPRATTAFLVAGIAFAAVLLLLNRARGIGVARWTLAALATLVTLLMALGGLVLVAGWTLTEHWVMWGNRNLLLLNPLLLALLPMWIMSAAANWQPKRWQRVLSLAIVIGAVLTLPLLLLPGAQHQLQWIALWLPVHLALACITLGRRS